MNLKNAFFAALLLVSGSVNAVRAVTEIDTHYAISGKRVTVKVAMDFPAGYKRDDTEIDYRYCKEFGICFSLDFDREMPPLIYVNGAVKKVPNASSAKEIVVDTARGSTTVYLRLAKETIIKCSFTYRDAAQKAAQLKACRTAKLAGPPFTFPKLTF